MHCGLCHAQARDEVLHSYSDSNPEDYRNSLLGDEDACGKCLNMVSEFSPHMLFDAVVKDFGPGGQYDTLLPVVQSWAEPRYTALLDKQPDVTPSVNGYIDHELYKTSVALKTADVVMGFKGKSYHSLGMKEIRVPDMGKHSVFFGVDIGVDMPEDVYKRWKRTYPRLKLGARWEAKVQISGTSAKMVIGNQEQLTMSSVLTGFLQRASPTSLRAASNVSANLNAASPAAASVGTAPDIAGEDDAATAADGGDVAAVLMRNFMPSYTSLVKKCTTLDEQAAKRRLNKKERTGGGAVIRDDEDWDDADGAASAPMDGGCGEEVFVTTPPHDPRSTSGRPAPEETDVANTDGETSDAWKSFETPSREKRQRSPSPGNSDHSTIAQSSAPKVAEPNPHRVGTVLYWRHELSFDEAYGGNPLGHPIHQAGLLQGKFKGDDYDMITIRLELVGCAHKTTKGTAKNWRPMRDSKRYGHLCRRLANIRRLMPA